MHTADIRASRGFLWNVLSFATTGYSPERIRQLVVGGKITTAKRGGKWLVDLQNILAFVVRRRAGPAHAFPWRW